MSSSERYKHQNVKKQLRLVAVSALVSVNLLLSTMSQAISPTVSDELKEIKLQQKRILAVNAIENVMGRYVFYHFANMYMDKDYVGLFANGDPDMKIDMSTGVWEGPDAAERVLTYYYKMAVNAGGADYRGDMHLHTLTSPVIEVAGDGQTARAVWLSPGLESGNPKNAEPYGMWIWVKYSAAFKKIENEWKIWQLCTYGIFLTPYEQSWIKPLETMWAPSKLPKEPHLQPNRPSSGRDMYTTSTKQTLNPAPPLPYATWDSSMSCVR